MVKQYRTIQTTTTMGKRSIESEPRVTETKRTKTMDNKIDETNNNDISGPNLMEALPRDLIVEVVSRVASSSMVDFFKFKLSCKTLEQIGKEKYIIRKVDIENFDMWRVWGNNHKDTAIAYSQICVDCDNPGALFKQGMKQYCRDMKVEEGMKSLEKAAKLGHEASSYALGLILLCCGGSEGERQKGMNLIKAVKARSGREIVDCRKKLRKFVKCEIWLHSEFVTQCKLVRFDKKDHHDKCSRKFDGFGDCYISEDDDDNDDVFCEACMWEFESRFFFHLFSLPKTR